MMNVRPDSYAAKARMTTTLSPCHLRGAEAVAARMDTSVSWVINRALKHYLEYVQNGGEP